MKNQEEAMITLASYTALADADVDSAEIELIVKIGMMLSAENPIVINGEDITLEILREMITSAFDNYIETMTTSDDSALALGLLLKQEAEMITDEKMRLMTLKFCALVGAADGSLDDIEKLHVEVCHAVWADMNDGWDYSFFEALEKSGINVVK